MLIFGRAVAHPLDQLVTTGTHSIRDLLGNTCSHPLSPTLNCVVNADQPSPKAKIKVAGE